MTMLMRQQLRLQQGKVAFCRAAAFPRRRLACSARAGGGNPREEPFNENAAQVKRLVQRDRKDFLGNEVDILDKYEKEFGSFEDPAKDGSSTPSTSSNGSSSSSAAPVASTSAAAAPAAASPAAPEAAAAKPASPFASSVASSFTATKPAMSSPFGPSASSTPYKKSVVEPKGLSPDMSPDPIKVSAAAPGNFLSRITLTQVVLFLSFSTIIGIMIATFSVVVSTGAVRLSGI